MAIHVHAQSFVYDLRLIRTLLTQHNEELFATQATRRAYLIVNEIIEVIEHEALYAQACTAAEARVGEAELQPEPDGSCECW